MAAAARLPDATVRLPVHAGDGPEFESTGNQPSSIGFDAAAPGRLAAPDRPFIPLPAMTGSPSRPFANRIVLITGASAGIGEACARAFAREGARLVLAARRRERLEALTPSLLELGAPEVISHTLDVRDRGAVIDWIAQLAASGHIPDVLVNNAGLSRGLSPLHEGEFRDWDEMIDTNVKGLLHVTRVLLPHMIEQGRGHVINLGSTAGHIVYPGGNVYNATKFAVRALTEALNLDLVGTPIRVSSVDPGLVETEFSIVRFRGDEERARRVYEGLEALTAADIAEIVRYVASAPPHVNIVQTVVYPTAQRSPWLIAREPEHP